MRENKGVRHLEFYPEPGGDLTYVIQDGDTQDNDDGGDPYTGFDRFGRLIDPFYADGSGDPVDRVQYGYDRNGNRLYRDNLLDGIKGSGVFCRTIP